MTVSERFHQAATRILEGDESIAAANELEGLALYSPGSGREYVDAPELRQLLVRTLEELA